MRKNMAIMPVKSFSQRSNYNANFEGKKHKEHQVMSRPISTSIKAVPLAALIAMSPMTPVNANPRLENSRNVIELAQEPQNKRNLLFFKNFNLEDNYYNYLTLNFEDTDDNKKTFEKVYVEIDNGLAAIKDPNMPVGLYGDIKKLNHIIYNVHDDYEEDVGPIGFTMAVMDAEVNGENKTIGIGDKAAIDSLKLYMNSDQNNANIPTEEIPHTIQYKKDGTFSGMKPAWIQKAQTNENVIMGTLYHSETVPGTDYILNLYDHEFLGKVMGLKKKNTDIPEMMVQGISVMNTKLISNGGVIGTVSMVFLNTGNGAVSDILCGDAALINRVLELRNTDDFKDTDFMKAVRYDSEAFVISTGNYKFQ